MWKEWWCIFASNQREKLTGNGEGIVIVRGNIRVVNEARCTSTNTGGGREGAYAGQRERERDSPFN